MQHTVAQLYDTDVHRNQDYPLIYTNSNFKKMDMYHSTVSVLYNF